MYLTNKTTITFNLPDEYEAQNNFIKTQDMSKWAVHEGSRGITYVHEDRYIADMQKGEPMSDLIPYKVIMGRVKDDIDFIAEQAHERGKRDILEQLQTTPTYHVLCKDCKHREETDDDYNYCYFWQRRTYKGWYCVNAKKRDTKS